MKKPCEKVVDCETCGRVVREDYYVSHKRSLRCQNDVDMTCKNCLKQFKSRRKAKYHSKICRKRLHCEKCNRKMTPLRFIKHMCFLVPADLKCQICLRSFKTSLTYRKHILMKDCNTRIKCETCGERIVVEKLEEHKDNNMKCRKRRHCEKCNRKMTPLRFKKHMCVIVPADLKCKNCLRSFKTRLTYKKHILMKDCNTRIKCETCGERIVVDKVEEHKDINMKCRKFNNKYYLKDDSAGS